MQINPQAFFFDFDGVVVNSEDCHFQAALQTLKPYHISFSREYYYNTLLAFDDIGLFKKIFADKKQELNTSTLSTLLQQKNKHFLELTEQQPFYFDGVVDFIKSLYDRQIPLAIVSGARKNEIINCLQKGNLTKFFEFIISADDVAFSKPHPESYESAFTKMSFMVPNLQKTECWVIEDSPGGIESAKGAGLHVVAITNSVPASALKKADLIIEHYNQIELESFNSKLV